MFNILLKLLKHILSIIDSILSYNSVSNSYEKMNEFKIRKKY